MAVRAVAAAPGLVFLLLGWVGTGLLLTAFLAVVGWLLWVGFLCCLSDCLDYPDLAKEAVCVTLNAFKLVICWVIITSLLLVFLLFTLLLAQVGGLYACFSPLAFCALVAGIIRYLLASGKFDTVLSLVLYPTGIPVIQRYLDLIGTTRMIIRRRS
jgi:hypothetical protein